MLSNSMPHVRGGGNASLLLTCSPMGQVPPPRTLRLAPFSPRPRSLSVLMRASDTRSTSSRISSPRRQSWRPQRLRFRHRSKAPRRFSRQPLPLQKKVVQEWPRLSQQGQVPVQSHPSGRVWFNAAESAAAGVWRQGERLRPPSGCRLGAQGLGPAAVDGRSAIGSG